MTGMSQGKLLARGRIREYLVDRRVSNHARREVTLTRKGTGDVVSRELLPHMDALYRYALSLTRQRDLAEDLTQETMLKGVRAFHQFEVGTNARAWLFRIMMNTWINQYKRRQASVEFDEGIVSLMDSSEDLSVWVHHGPNPEACLVSKFSRAQVQEAVEKLPTDFRTVVVLADLDGFAYKDIADIVGCPIGTVMSRLHRGRRLLRMSLARWAKDMGLIDDDGIREGAGEEEDTGKVTPLSAYRDRRSSVQSGREGRDEV